MEHTVLKYGLENDLRSRGEARYEAAKPLWRRAYASTNFHEFFAELTMWYVGSRGDFTSLPSPASGADLLARHDPDSFALLDGIYTGAVEPGAIEWERLRPSDASASISAESSVSLTPELVSLASGHFTCRGLK